MRPLLYVAGPYIRPDPVENTHRAIRVGEAIYDLTNWVPIVPHVTMLWHLVSPHEVDYWYEYDLHVLRRCQAVVRLPGASTGADREMDEAWLFRLVDVPYHELPRPVRDIWEGLA